ncbi:alpha-soluble NSF attachment protein-like isoform X2 [Anneissia japonica]|uniref:alpha-soluble NSF attachment protein-like isoform X2 n=1 Tax=Anneissia japonica TaxID=1529436 RepID=UPI001425A203|nr:alpha-soluble NSF attachment protein-like isoform X2 [Anneissia japonica]
MADQEQKGKELMAEAEKKVRSSQTFFGSLFGGSTTKLEEASEIYQRAANSFKMAKAWSAAGKAFKKSASLEKKMKNKPRAGYRLAEAGSCYKKVDGEEAVRCLQQAIEIFTDMGRFTIAAKHLITVAEIYEGNSIDLEKAIEYYERAADYYKGEDSTSSANKCLLKVAQYSAQLENYGKSVEIYEEVAEVAVKTPLLKYSAKDYFFKAALCQMCIDTLNAKLAVQKYEEMFAAFADSREYKLLNKLLAALEEEDVDGYTDAVKEYDSISRLDQWLTTILLRIKKSIGGMDLT